MRCRLLYVPQWDANVLAGSYEAVPERMRSDVLSDSSPAGQSPDYPRCCVAVESVRSPFRARKEIKAWSWAELSPAATSRAPSYSIQSCM